MKKSIDFAEVGKEALKSDVEYSLKYIQEYHKKYGFNSVHAVFGLINRTTKSISKLESCGIDMKKYSAQLNEIKEKYNLTD